jgi:hypothetical protein
LAGPNGPARGFTLEFGYSIADGPVQNATTGEYYDYIQHAVADAQAGAEIVVPAGAHDEQIDFLGKAVTVRSVDPHDPAIVAATVLQGRSNVVTFGGGEGADSVLDGLSVAGGHNGVLCYGATPTLARCSITGNERAGVDLEGQSNPTIVGCSVVANGGPGLDMWAPREGRIVRHNQPTIRNCVIAGNGGAGVYDGRPTITNSTIIENRGVGIDTSVATVANSIVFFNGESDDSVQISGNFVDTTYSAVQGGWPGAGNIDADPRIVALGNWSEAGWTPGDYHLQSEGLRWDAQSRSWVSDTITSPCIDAGDPASDLLDEPAADGALSANLRVNMGAYGGTAEASLAP